MYTQAAETMWTSLTEKLNDYNHILELALFGLENFLQSFQNREYFFLFSFEKYIVNHVVKLNSKDRDRVCR